MMRVNKEKSKGSQKGCHKDMMLKPVWWEDSSQLGKEYECRSRIQTEGIARENVL